MLQNSLKKSGRRYAGLGQRRRLAPLAARLGAPIGALVLGLGGCAEPEPRARVVLITLDTLRYDSFAGGGADATMPRLRDWARGAAAFERFYAATGSTQPTHASLFTGLHPWQHGVTRNGLRLDERHPTVAELLRDAGFDTAAVVASFPVSARFGFGQGFERYTEDFDAGELAARVWVEATERYAGAGDGPPPERGDSFYARADHVLTRALAELDRATARRQFFWFHFFDPHSPYGDSATGVELRPAEILLDAGAGEDVTAAVAHARRLYDADVAWLDDALGRLLDRLAADEDRFETHVVVVSDHGESFGEAGSMGHGRRLIPSQLHVPCLIRSPRLPPGPRSEVAGSIDLATTLLALADVAPPAGWPRGGRDLARANLRPAPAVGMRITFSEPYRDQRLDGSVHTLSGNLFFLLGEDGELVRGSGERLLPFPGSSLDPASPRADELRRLFAGFEEELARNRAEADRDPETERKLRALGYVE